MFQMSKKNNDNFLSLSPRYVNVSKSAEKVESEISLKLSRRESKRHLLGHIGKPNTWWRQANLS